MKRWPALFAPIGCGPSYGAHHRVTLCNDANNGTLPKENTDESIMINKSPDAVSPLLRLRESIAFFRVYGWELARFCIVLYLPVVLVSLILPEAGADNGTTGFPALAFIFNFFYQPIYSGALIYQLARIEAGQAGTVREGFVIGVRLWDKLLLVNLITLVLALLGFMAFIFPSLIVYARLALAEFRVVLNGDRPKEALKNSFAMTRPYMLPIIACTAVLIGVFLAAQLAVEWLTVVLAMPLLFPVTLNTILSVVFMLFLTIVLFRFYGLAGDAIASSE